MILVVSAWIAAEELALLDPIVSVTLESLDDRVKDDDVSKKLLDATSAEELDSSTALLSPPSGPEPLESSPQATNSTAAAIRTIFPRHLLKSLAIIVLRIPIKKNRINLCYFHCPCQITDNRVQNKTRMNKVFLNPPYNDLSLFLK